MSTLSKIEMKSFVDFRFICEKLNKTHDEDSQSKLWNYFIANSKILKLGI